EAEADDARALVRLVAALGEVKRAEDSVRAGNVHPSLVARVSKTKDVLTRLRDETEERSRRSNARSALRSSIHEIALRPAEDWGRELGDSSRISTQMYAEAFRNAGIDLNDPRAAEIMRTSEMREDFIAALDNWTQALDRD